MTDIETQCTEQAVFSMFCQASAEALGAESIDARGIRSGVIVLEALADMQELCGTDELLSASTFAAVHDEVTKDMPDVSVMAKRHGLTEILMSLDIIEPSDDGLVRYNREYSRGLLDNLSRQTS